MKNHYLADESRRDGATRLHHLDGIRSLLAFIHHNMGIRPQIHKYLRPARRPAYLQALHAVGISQPEMNEGGHPPVGKR